MIRKLYVVRFNLKPKNDRMLFSPYFHAGTYTEQPVYSYKVAMLLLAKRLQLFAKNEYSFSNIESISIREVQCKHPNLN